MEDVDLKKTLIILIILSVAIIFMPNNKNESSKKNNSMKNEAVMLMNTEKKYSDNEKNSEKKVTIHVLIEFAEDNEIEKNFDCLTATNLENLRKNVKKYYTEENQKKVALLDLDSYDYVVSWYAPFVEIRFSNIIEYENNENDLVSKISNNNIVNDYNVMYTEKSESTKNETNYSDEYPLALAYEDINVTNSNFTGNGIKIGVIDDDVPYDNANFNVDSINKLSVLTGSHSTSVVSIIGGSSGIAKNAEFYCVSVKDKGLTNSLNILINESNVNIINMSIFIDNDSSYNLNCILLDKVSYNTQVTIIKSAGNTGDKITSPGCSLNSITVGSIDKNHKVSNFSSWDTSDNMLIKPDMVAPGGNISQIPNITGNQNGTSFSAPMVTGISALLMEEFPELKYNSSMLKTILQAGCTKLSDGDDQYEKFSGFGLINYENSRTCMLEKKIDSFEIKNNTIQNELLWTKDNVCLNYYDLFKINLNWNLIDAAHPYEISGVLKPKTSNLLIKVYDKNLNSYILSKKTSYNTGFLEYKNTTKTTHYFKIEIYFVDRGSLNLNQSENVSLAFEQCTHLHSYSQWKFVDDSKHIEACKCGLTGYNTAPHMISASDIGRRKTCVLCNHIVNIDDSIVIVKPFFLDQNNVTTSLYLQSDNNK